MVTQLSPKVPKNAKNADPGPCGHSCGHEKKRVVVTRKAGPREMASTAEVAALEPPRTWSIRGVDGSVRGNVKGRVEPVNGGNRSRVTIELDLQGHGIGKLLLPLVVNRQAKREMPQNMQRLKERLESQ